MDKEDDYYLAKSINNNNGNDYDDMVNNHIFNNFGNNLHHHQKVSTSSGTGACLDRLSFADVMQFADFGPKLGLNHHITQHETTDTDTCINAIETSTINVDPIYFLKFPVLNDNKLDPLDMVPPPPPQPNLLSSNNYYEEVEEEDKFGGDNIISKEFEEEETQGNNSITRVTTACGGLKNKRKRPRSVKTTEEVESQRMTHIAVERNRRKQMNEHLRVLRSLMPGSYVQRGDQASIIGGAIEFVRELEQLLQCLESQKRRRIYGGDDNNLLPPPEFSNNNNSTVANMNMLMNNDDIMNMGHHVVREESAEKKSSLADVEVKLLGFDAIIKILCRRRPGQLIKTIAALEDLQLNILHTNITTIEQTVLYSFNIKVASELQLNAEDIASSVQQIFTFIHGTSNV